MSKIEIPTISVAELRAALAEYPDHYQVSFSGLEFYRVKQRDEELVQIEFNPHVYRNSKGCVVVESPE